MAVSKRMRFEVLRRNGFRCHYCGAGADKAELTVDHVTPVALGGIDDPSNLVTACEPCNSGKTSTTPDAELVADVAEDAARWSAAMQQAAAAGLEEARAIEEYRAPFLDAWKRWMASGKRRTHAVLPDNWKSSMDHFRTAGLPAQMWPEIMDLAMGNRKIANVNVFRYACGIAWNKVHALQEEAQRLLNGAGLPDPSEPHEDQLAEVDARAEVSFRAWEQELSGEAFAALSPRAFSDVRGQLVAMDLCGHDPRVLWAIAVLAGRAGSTDIVGSLFSVLDTRLPG
jgi:hypothetical protein